MNRHPRTDSLSNTAGPPSDRHFQGFTNTTRPFHKQRVLCGDPQIHFVPIARRGDGPQHSALPQIVNTVACRWVHPPSDPLQGVKVHTSTPRRAGNPPPPPATQPGGDGCAEQCCGPQKRWSCAVLPRRQLCPQHRRPVRQLVSTKGVNRKTCWGGGPRHHHERSVEETVPSGHARTLMAISHLCRPRSHRFRSRNSFLCVFIGLLLQLHSARRVVLSSPTTFAASCFIGRGRCMLFLCSLNRLGEWAAPFLGTSIAR
ncbi:hypothetical protein TCSYLVIO_007728 [Trypanosoma cruzi]|nr:hypothetical protein TCSYLVIO_007728 [Trypanosoma cruzi]